MKFVVSKDQNMASFVMGGDRIDVVARPYMRSAAGSTCAECVFHPIRRPEDKPCYAGLDVSLCSGDNRADQRVIVWRRCER